MGLLIGAGIYSAILGLYLHSQKIDHLFFQMNYATYVKFCTLSLLYLVVIAAMCRKAPVKEFTKIMMVAAFANTFAFFTFVSVAVLKYDFDSPQVLGCGLTVLVATLVCAVMILNSQIDIQTRAFDRYMKEIKRQRELDTTEGPNPNSE